MSTAVSSQKLLGSLQQSTLRRVQLTPLCYNSVMKMSTLTKGDQELHGFLTEEIATEKKQQRTTSLPANLAGFDIKTDGAEVTLTKKIQDELVEISLNVNHTVDADDFEETQGQGQGQNAAQEAPTEMRSKPNFEVDLKRGNTVLSFSCSYVRDASPPTEEEYSDAFVIDEITMYEGEFNDKVYAVAGDILDGYLYDLFMNLLEERGVSNDFVEQLSDFCTDYEHQQYIRLLSRLQEFVGKK